MPPTEASSKEDIYQHAKHGNNSAACPGARSQCQAHCLAAENATGRAETGAPECCKEFREQEELFPIRRSWQHKASHSRNLV